MGPTYFRSQQIPLRSLLQKYVAPEVHTGKETCNFFLSNQLWIKCKNTSLTPKRNCFLKSSFVYLFRIRLSRLCSWMCDTKMSCHNTYHFRKILPIRKYKLFKKWEHVECHRNYTRKDLFLERIATLCNIILSLTLELQALEEKSPWYIHVLYISENFKKNTC